MLKQRSAYSIVTYLFPKTIDNTLAGHPITLYAFYLITVITLWRSLHHIFAPDGGAESIATIPVSTFSDTAQSTVIGMFALWGLSQLIIAIIFVLAALKYKRIIPMLYVLLIFEYTTRILIGVTKPIPTVSTAPGAAGNLPLVLICTGLLLIGYYTARHKSHNNTIPLTQMKIVKRSKQANLNH